MSPIPVDKVQSKTTNFTPKPADDTWHDLAKDWYNSLFESGESEFYEPSDWATARIVAEAISCLFRIRGKLSGQGFAAVMSEAANLLTTEGQRRRLRIEIQKGGSVEEPKSAKIIGLYRARAANGGS